MVRQPIHHLPPRARKRGLLIRSPTFARVAFLLDAGAHLYIFTVFPSPGSLNLFMRLNKTLSALAFCILSWAMQGMVNN